MIDRQSSFLGTENKLVSIHWEENRPKLTRIHSSAPRIENLGAKLPYGRTTPTEDASSSFFLGRIWTAKPTPVPPSRTEHGPAASRVPAVSSASVERQVPWSDAGFYYEGIVVRPGRSGTGDRTGGRGKTSMATCDAIFLVQGVDLTFLEGWFSFKSTKRNR